MGASKKRSWRAGPAAAAALALSGLIAGSTFALAPSAAPRRSSGLAAASASVVGVPVTASRPAEAAAAAAAGGGGGGSSSSIAWAASAAAIAALVLTGRTRGTRRLGSGASGLGHRPARGFAQPLRSQSLCKESDPPESVRRKFEAICAKAQDQICAAIEEVDGKAKFSRDAYTRGENPGGGVARVLTDGNVFEKAGVNLSVVYGEMPEEAVKAATGRGADRVGTKLEPGQKVPFFACGLSSVMHPKNPFCPTMHFNYRYFETDFGTWWFGGGTDITPAYLDREDMTHFHGTYKKVCDEFDPTWYPKFKDWADRYFRIEHRGETRGLGGIFFDDFSSEAPERHLMFSEKCLAALTDAYVPLLQKHKDDAFTPEQKAWQLMRRGRYVEFNLVYDRGTIFGLKMLASGLGRIESILMSLPETARWQYAHEPEPGSEEAEIMECFKTPQQWV